jgi:hypothetical protein
MSDAQMSIESQRTGAALRKSEEHYRAVADAATDATWIRVCLLDHSKLNVDCHLTVSRSIDELDAALKRSENEKSFSK